MADNNGGFLGGGPQFNKVGAPAPTDGTELEAPQSQSMQPHQIRAIVIVVVILVMLGIIYRISDPGGVGPKGGPVGHATQAPPATPRNF